MKLVLLIILGITLGLWAFSQGITTFKLPITNNYALPSASPKEETIPYEVTFNNVVYAIYIAEIVNPKNVSLIPNFTEKNTASTTFTEKQCNLLINGGFYTTNNKPLGLFFVNGTYLEENKNRSTIHNGFVFKTKSGSLEFGQTVSDSTLLDFAFQTGPYFSKDQKLTISPDSYDRRSLLGISQNGIYAIAVTELENTSSGPYLADIPQLFAQIPIPFSHFINLDGGSASAFYTHSISIGELTAVGSFLCMRS